MGKIGIFLQVDEVFYNATTIKDDYLRAQVTRFYKGGNIPLGLFENEKPTTAAPTTIRPSCDLTSLNDGVPDQLAPSSNNETRIEPGDTVEYTCKGGANKVRYVCTFHKI